MTTKPHSKKAKLKPTKLVRWLFSIATLLLLFYLNETQSLEEIHTGEPPVLYSSICRDNLEDLFLEAITGAERSILLVIYSLSDTKLIQALNKKADKDVCVKVIHDLTTPHYGFQKLSPKVEKQGVKLSGLMHRKILVVDGEKVWLGSANWTTESLKVHDNLVIGVVDPLLAQTIEQEEPFSHFALGGQQVEFWSLPQKGKEGLKRVVEAIDQAKKSIRVAMFTWTHAELTQAIIHAQTRGVSVEIFLDRGQARGVSHATLEKLVQARIPVRLSSGQGLLHHKFVWIDEELLINGSANWTVAAFTKNHDCFLILYPLTQSQNAKMQELWKRTKRITQEEGKEEVLRLAA